MNCQMIRVISSPSSSTMGFFTVILAMAAADASAEAWGRPSMPRSRPLNPQGCPPMTRGP